VVVPAVNVDPGTACSGASRHLDQVRKADNGDHQDDQGYNRAHFRLLNDSASGIED
jgi:hypothetical protein